MSPKENGNNADTQHQQKRAGGPGFMGGGGNHMPPQKVKNIGATLKRLLAYLRPQLPKIIAVLIFTIASTTAQIFGPKILGNGITEIINGAISMVKGGSGINFDTLTTIALTLLGIYVLSAALNYVQAYVMAGVAQNLVFDMRRDVDEKFNRLPLSYYDSRSTGEVLSRMVNDVDLIASSLQESLTQVLQSVVFVIGVIIMMLTISPTMTLIALISIPFSIIITMFIAKRSQKLFAAQQATLGDLNGHIEEMYTGHVVMRAFGQEERSVEQFDTINKKLYGHAWRANFISGIVRPAMLFVGNATYALVAAIGGIMVINGHMDVGYINTFIQYTRQMNQPITQLANATNVIQSTLAASERVFELLDEPDQVPETTDPKTIDDPKGDVKFEHVRFGYTPDKVIIKDLSFEAKPGEMVAIVGPTGAGKTTLVNLLMRFYEIDSGEILIDGVDTRDLTREDLRHMFGMVLQDTWLFNGTIRDNIKYGAEGATEEDMVRAAEIAHVDHFVRTLSDGYDTVIDESGSNISVGQKQLITIARAVLADPSVLILDEATSSIDTRTERLIQSAMKNLMHGRTSFVIAHRLSTIQEADTILVVRDGDIVEKGNHNELLAQGGFYASLYNSQFADFDEIEDVA